MPGGACRVWPLTHATARGSPGLASQCKHLVPCQLSEEDGRPSGPDPADGLNILGDVERTS